jgi:archaeosortase B (VPXXXP-CTERM-specific)
VLYQLTEVTHLFRRVNELNALLCGLVLRFAGVPNARTGTTLQLPTTAFHVISECSAVYVAILYAAAVLAFPAAWRARGRGLAAGLVIIFAVNILRLVTLGEVMHRRPAWLPLFHEYLWQVLFILIVAAIYIAWIERTVPRARTRAAA